MLTEPRKRKDLPDWMAAIVLLIALAPAEGSLLGLGWRLFRIGAGW